MKASCKQCGAMNHWKFKDSGKNFLRFSYRCVCGFIDTMVKTIKPEKKPKALPKSPLDISYDYAVMNDNRKTPCVRVFDEEKTAEDYINRQQKPSLFRIEERKRK